MSFLIDTNVISEVRKGRRCNANVATWYASIDDGDLQLSVLVLGEIRKGIELARPRDPSKAEALETWLASVDVAFEGRILPIDRAVAEEWGRMSGQRPVSTVDGLLAATAKVHRLTLVTRNERDVMGLGAKVLNPFGRR
ncbi:MAG: type II toxin-antitoxin system VapC family toxin [Rhodospirillaceae bacterium]|nr:type II toxin-antitoxin system VapC family toxin [Rhodospirillaceae bacterium]